MRNAPVPPGNTGTLTGTSITGLNLFTLSEVQRFTVQAKSGKYVLRAPGYGDVTLNYTAPLFLAVLSAVWLHERHGRGLLLAVVLGFIGIGSS